MRSAQWSRRYFFTSNKCQVNWSQLSEEIAVVRFSSWILTKSRNSAMDSAHLAYQNWTMDNWNTTVPVFTQTSARIFQLTVVFLGMPIRGFASFVLISIRQLWEPRHLSLLPLIIIHLLLFIQSTLYYLASVHQFIFCCWLFTIFYGYYATFTSRYQDVCNLKFSGNQQTKLFHGGCLGPIVSIIRKYYGRKIEIPSKSQKEI